MRDPNTDNARYYYATANPNSLDTTRSGTRASGAGTRWTATHASGLSTRRHRHSCIRSPATPGEVLAQLHERLRTERAVGYDISRYAIALARKRKTPGLRFCLAEASQDDESSDLMLMLGVY